MDAVSSTTQSNSALTTAAAQTQGQSNAAASADSLASDFDTFLTLLTTQLRNQDPLEPTDPTQFVEQLATFSSVEQQVETNRQVAELVASLGGGDASGLVEFIGRRVEAPLPLRFDGDNPVSVTTAPVSGAQTASLVVIDENGAEISRSQVSPAQTALVWDGDRSVGGTADEGFYSFRVDYVDEDGEVTSVTPTGFTRVTEARLVDDGISLVTESGDAILSSEISAVSE